MAYLIGIANRNARTANFAVQLTTTNQRLKSEIADRERAEERQARSLTRLEGVNRLQEDLLLPAPIEEKFKKITEAAVELLDLDFCRIWTVKPGDLCDKGCIHVTAEEQCHICPRRDKCLHLMARSGRYTHIDGNHRRVPLGCYKIGRIVSGEDNKFLTNSVTTDPRVHNHEWAKDLGLCRSRATSSATPAAIPSACWRCSPSIPFPKKTAFLSNLAEMTSRVIIDDKVDKACTPANGISDFSPRMRAIFLTIDCRPVHLPQPLRGADAGIHAGGGHAVDDPPSNGTIFVYPRSKDA